MTKLIDNDGRIMDYRVNNLGAILMKGKRQVYLLFRSVNAGNEARKLIAENSFNKLFTKGKKVNLLGNNISHIKLD